MDSGRQHAAVADALTVIIGAANSLDHGGPIVESARADLLAALVRQAEYLKHALQPA